MRDHISAKRDAVLEDLDRICTVDFNDSSEDIRAGTLVLSSPIPTTAGAQSGRPESTSGAGGDGFASLRSARHSPGSNK